MTSRALNVALYRQLLRAARGFTNYNFRDYALRHIRDDVRAASTLEGEKAQAAYRHGKTQLEMLKRQSAISAMFPTGKHSMEVAVGEVVPTVHEESGSRFDEFGAKK